MNRNKRKLVYTNAFIMVSLNFCILTRLLTMALGLKCLTTE